MKAVASVRKCDWLGIQVIKTIKQHIRSIIPLPLLLILSACAEQGPAVVSGVSLELAQHRAAVISDINYQLALRIPEDQGAEISGTMSISFSLDGNSAPLQLDFRENAANVISVETNGSLSRYRFENEHIVIPENEAVDGQNLIEIEFIAGSTSLNRNPEFLYTLFVPDRARTAFPLFDQPDLKATYDLTLVVPTDWTAMANAPVETVTRGIDDTAYEFSTTDLISSYLFSFVVGKFASIERNVNGRTMVMIHRETDDEKVARNVDAIFELHGAALDWLEEYTGIDYPYKKFGFALIPSFQYGGMEHVGAIQYRASGLLLDESPSEPRLLGRAGLISHETAHMWFGDLVTMEWFNDVWTKEVFANFMAAKIVNPGFPDINHDLNFLVRHYPGAYSVDRTTGANSIRQYLPNLNEAGQMYGSIIYAKAPIMMRQLELLIGEDEFREGMREYLAKFSFANATWPALVDILDQKTTADLSAWSEVWVNTSGRPVFVMQADATAAGARGMEQLDPAGENRVWPQVFEMSSVGNDIDRETISMSSPEELSLLDFSDKPSGSTVIINSDGLGYGLFPASIDNLRIWDQLNDVEKGSVLIYLYENLLEDSVDPAEYQSKLSDIVTTEQNQLILNLALGQMRRIYWTFLPVTTRDAIAPQLEETLWNTMSEQTNSSKKKLFFDTFADIAITTDAVRKVYDVWSEALVVEGLPLSENDHIDLAQTLALKLPGRSDEIISAQLAKTKNPDSQRRLTFVTPSLSADKAARDRFFASLADEENRNVESWVLDALQNIHHPLRTDESEEYLLASLELLQEIQQTGDIFFPKRWLDVTLRNYRSGTAVHTVRTFLDERPDYNGQLRMKILQSADTMFRASTIAGADQVQ
jgi:aminopeptidase N